MQQNTDSWFILIIAEFGNFYIILTYFFKQYDEVMIHVYST